MASPGTVSARAFFEALWGPTAPEGYVELTLIRPNAQKQGDPDEIQQWFYPWPSEFDKFLARAALERGNWNVYFGVGLRSRRRGRDVDVLATTALHCDIDFKKTPKPEAIKRLKEFPLKASAGTLTGGGIHAYWFLKEAATGDDLQKIRAINKAIVPLLGGDPGACSLKQILRVPESTNIKYETRPEVKIAVWRPDARHSLLDFDFLDVKSGAPDAAGVSVQVSSPETPAASLVAIPVADIVKKIIKDGLPSYVDFLRASVPPEKIKEKDMSRSGADAYVVFQLLVAGTSETQLYEIYRDPSNRIGEKYREKRDGDKYLGVTIQNCKNHLKDHPRATAISFAIAAARKAKMDSEDSKLTISKIQKVEYNPPIWKVTTTIPETGEEHTTNCSHREFVAYARFREAFVAQHRKFPPMVTQGAWERFANAIEWEIQEVDHEIASTDGEVKSALDEWLSQAKREANDATMQYLPVIDEEEKRVYLKVPAFMQYLNSQKIDAKRREVTQALKDLGYKRETKRFGKGTAKVWAKEHGNGQPKELGVDKVKGPESGQQDALF